METPARTKLSSDFYFTKSILIFLFFYAVAAIFNIGQKPPEDEFEHGQRIILLAISVGGLIYFFTRPKIYFDNVSLYIKKMRKEEMVIPLKKVKSFFKSPLSVNKGTANFEIEFINGSNELCKINFNGDYSSSKIKEFKTLIKTVNPHCEII